MVRYMYMNHMVCYTKAMLDLSNGTTFFSQKRKPAGCSTISPKVWVRYLPLINYLFDAIYDDLLFIVQLFVANRSAIYLY